MNDFSTHFTVQKTATAKKLDEVRVLTDKAIGALFEVVNDQLIGWDYITPNGRDRIEKAFFSLLDVKKQLRENK
jgi:hypothetical protein